MTKNILYIHGFGSNKDSYTGNSLKQLFPEYHWILETFNLLDVHACNEKIKQLISAHDIDTVISSSLGCIYNLFIKKNETTGKIVNKILINPCCYPSKELPKLDVIPQDALTACKAVEFNVYQVHQDNTSKNLFGIFAKNDDLLQYHDFFAGRYGNGGENGRITASNCIWVEGGHSGLTKKTLKDAFQQATHYFDEIAEKESVTAKSTTEKPTLYIDMDGTLVDWESGQNRLTEMEKLQYDGYEDEIPGIFSRMDPMSGAIEAFCQLQTKYDVYILSTAPWRNATAPSDKLRWVQKHFGIEKNSPAYKRLILSHHKELNRGDIIIDDRIDKNGAGNFKTAIPFGKAPYETWPKVVEYLMNL